MIASARIGIHNRIILTICKHIDALNVIITGHKEGVRIDEAAGFGVIVTALEIVELRLDIIVVSPVSQRILDAHSIRKAARDGYDLAHSDTTALTGSPKVSAEVRAYSDLERISPHLS